VQVLNVLAVCVISYLLGSIPFGLIVVWIASGKDVRQVGSGRTGGTNAMRAAGTVAGLITAVCDFAKGAATVLVVHVFFPGSAWIQIIAAILAIWGHNYSIFLIEKNSAGRLRLAGGAGGATCLGGAVALWPPSLLIILPLVALVYVGIGFASVTTMSIAVSAIVLFAVRAGLGLSPWEYVVYGVISLGTILWALRPNLKRLREGNERAVGLRAYFQKKRNKKQDPK
jgi:acyl phosphate:glycerol-3-phosphate acyltransferase